MYRLCCIWDSYIHGTMQVRRGFRGNTLLKQSPI